MFSQAYVKNSLNRRGGHALQGGVHGGGMCGRGMCMAGGIHDGGVHGRGACVAGETATAADGMHSSGMHYCLHKCFSCLIYLFRNCCVRQNV